MFGKNGPRQRSCLSVKPLYRCLMVHCESTEPLIVQTYDEDAVVEAHWFDVRDQGLELEAIRLAIKAGATIYFVTQSIKSI